MNENEFKTNVTVTSETPFSKRMHILLIVALLSTGITSCLGIFYIINNVKEQLPYTSNFIPFATTCRFHFCIFISFIALYKIFFSKKAFSKTLVICVKMIGIVFLISAYLFPHIPGYQDRGFVLFFADGFDLTIGLLIFIFGLLLQEAFHMQTALDNVL